LQPVIIVSKNSYPYRPHRYFEYRVWIRRENPRSVPLGRRYFLAECDEEAVHKAKAILKINGPMTMTNFRRAGGVCIVQTSEARRRKGKKIFP
jgi:hypothetical protein